jgi:hypothetical protein
MALSLLAKGSSHRYQNLLIRLNVLAAAFNPLQPRAEAICQADFLLRSRFDLVYFKLTPDELLEAYDTIGSGSRRALRAAARCRARMRKTRGCASAYSRPPAVEDLPWELLYDPLLNDFLTLSSRRRILRQGRMGCSEIAASEPARLGLMRIPTCRRPTFSSS